MAAVAGAVADEMLQALVHGRTLDKAYVNDGGDIAIHLTPGHELRAGIFAAALDGVARLTYDRPVRGIATSGRGGRSFSLGIADTATVLAATAAAADAAATLIANAVNVEHVAIERRPARDLDPDSDLGDLPVTVAVGALPPALVEEALDRGAIEARRLRLCGLIDGAALSLQGRWRIDAQSSLEPTGDGWARSQWDERTPIHVGSDKVHLKVAFSRWRADGSLIGRFETIYIVTLQDGHWGMQARSSFAS
jgi:hypothetical protein